MVDAVPQPLDDGFARYLAMTKQQLLSDGADGQLTQPGGAYLERPFVLPDLSAIFGTISEPLIETFTVSDRGVCTPMGSDPMVARALLSCATEMAARTLEAINRFGIGMDGLGYLTASVSPLAQVTDEPHVDDDQYLPHQGVGLVAIAADHNGTRLATDAIAHRSTTPGLPLELEEGVGDRFGQRRLAGQQAEAHRIVVFPQFGQLHAGPSSHDLPSDLPAEGTVRSLLVFRMQTLVRC